MIWVNERNRERMQSREWARKIKCREGGEIKMSKRMEWEAREWERKQERLVLRLDEKEKRLLISYCFFSNSKKDVWSNIHLP